MDVAIIEGYSDSNLYKEVDITITESVSLDEIKKGKKPNSIIVIPHDDYVKMALDNAGFVEFEHYTYDDCVGKKIAVFYGNCHMVNLSQLLGKSRNFTNEIYIYPVLPIYKIKDVSYFEQPVFKHCDILVHQSIRENNKFGKDFSSSSVVSRTKASCRIISAPNIYHLPMCYFPQYMEKEELKDKEGNTLFFRDEIIENEILKHKAISEVAKTYLNTSGIYSEEVISSLWNKYIESVKQREEQWDIGISSFLISNKSKLLFYDPNHPTEMVIRYIADRVFDLLKISNDLGNIHCHAMDTYQMPLCRDVVDYFGMDYDLEKVKLRETGIRFKASSMSVHEYARQYCSMLWKTKIGGKLLAKSIILHIFYCSNKWLERLRGVFWRIIKRFAK